MASTSWPTFCSTTNDNVNRQLSSAACDFLATLASVDIKIYHRAELKIRHLTHLSLGIGGFAAVQQARLKRSR